MPRITRADEAKEFARRIVDSEEYRQLCVVRLFEGTLPPAVEVLLLHYRYGKPADTTHLTMDPGPADALEGMTRAELAARARELAARLEAEAAAEAPPATAQSIH